MNTQRYKTTILATLSLIAAGAIAFGYQVWSVAAQSTDPVVTLTINGGSNAEIVAGEPVLLEWYIAGAVTNCSIDNGVGAINTSSLPGTPVSGSRTVTPSGPTTYRLTCTGGSDSVEAAPSPVVRVTSPDGSRIYYNPDDPQPNTYRVSWTTENVSNCTEVKRTDGNGITRDRKYVSGTSGTVTFNDVFEGSYFYVFCNNATGNLTLSVIPETPPEARLVFTATPSIVTPDPVYGWAYAGIRADAYNTHYCDFGTEKENGQTISSAWDGGGGSSNWQQWYRSIGNIGITEPTRFTADCVRSVMYNMNGLTWPRVEYSESILVSVNYPGGGDDPASWDRTTSPAAVATINGTTNGSVTLQGSPSDGTVETVLQTRINNVDNCTFTAKRLNGQSISVNGWTTRSIVNRQTNWDLPITVTIDESVRFILDCYRSFDQQYGNAAEQANGSAHAEYVVRIDNSALSLEDPESFLYPKWHKITATKIFNTQTAGFGYHEDITRTYTGYSFYDVRNTNFLIGESATNNITFPFDGEDGTYDVILGVCDEPGMGDYSDFTITFPSGNGAYRTEYHSGSQDGCGTLYSPDNYMRRVVAENIALNTGDSITVTCSPNGDEKCAFLDMFFGQGNNATVDIVTPNTEEQVAVLWVSHAASECMSEPAEFDPPSASYGATQSWSTWGYSTGVYGFSNFDSSADFAISCSRGSLSDRATSHVNFTSGTEITAEVTVGVGECIDPATNNAISIPAGYEQGPAPDYWCVGPDECVDTDGSVISTPDGYTQGAAPGYACEEVSAPAVDIAALDPSYSLDNATFDNGVNQYDNIEFRVAMENLGPGDVPADSALSYVVEVTKDSITRETPVEFFNGALTASGPNSQSPTLTVSMDDLDLGEHEVCARVNLDGSPDYPEPAGSLANNRSRCITMVLTGGEPTMSLTVGRDLIRSGETAEVSWSVDASYPLDCTVEGIGISESFDPSDRYPAPGGPHVGTEVTDPLTSSAVYELRCAVPSTDTVYTRPARVEVIPAIEEI